MHVKPSIVFEIEGNLIDKGARVNVITRQIDKQFNNNKIQ